MLYMSKKCCNFVRVNIITFKSTHYGTFSKFVCCFDVRCELIGV